MFYRSYFYEKYTNSNIIANIVIVSLLIYPFFVSIVTIYLPIKLIWENSYFVYIFSLKI